MDLFTKALKDEWGTTEIVIYEFGKFSQPLLILTEGFAKKLADSILEDLEQSLKKGGMR